MKKFFNIIKHTYHFIMYKVYSTISYIATISGLKLVNKKFPKQDFIIIFESSKHRIDLETNYKFAKRALKKVLGITSIKNMSYENKTIKIYFEDKNYNEVLLLLQRIRKGR